MPLMVSQALGRRATRLAFGHESPLPHHHSKHAEKPGLLAFRSSSCPPIVHECDEGRSATVQEGVPKMLNRFPQSRCTGRGTRSWIDGPRALAQALPHVFCERENS